MIDSKILSEIIKYILDVTPTKPFLCLPMSASLYAILKDEFKIDVRLVTGDFLYKGNYIFKHDFPISTAKNGEFQEWAGHAWVEFDKTIYDLSFLRTLHSKEFNKPFKRELIEGFGQSTGSLILTQDFLKSVQLQYKPVETLSDDLATGILKGYEDLLKRTNK